MFTGTLVICLVPTALLAGDDNPFAKAKVSDWVEYKMTGPNMEGKTKMTIVATAEKEVTYEVAATFNIMGTEMTGPVQKITVDLTKPYDQISAANMKRTGTTAETLGEGAEKLKIGDKEYETKWTKVKYTTTTDNVTVVSEFKMWYCKDVPVSGLVRMETTVGMFNSKLELIGSGRK